MKNVYTLFIALLAASAYTQIALSMSQQALPVQKKAIPVVKPITQWPDFLYGEPFPGAVSLVDKIDPALFEKAKNEATTLTKERADELQLTELARVSLDWQFALAQSEKELLVKPFFEWTIEDISKLSGWLTRLTVENPGSLRTEDAFWTLKECTEEEKVRIEQILAPEQQTEEERAFLQQMYYLFPAPDLIRQRFEVALKSMRRSLRRVKELKTAQERENTIIRLSANMFLEIVKIHPYTGGHKRLGRFIMYVILAQNGFEPFTFYDQDYLERLKAGLKGDAMVFLDYCLLSQRLCGSIKANPLYKAILTELVQNPNPADTRPLSQKLTTHPLHQAFLVYGNKKETQSTTLEKCCSACNKIESSELKLKVCGNCKSVFYCSGTCQTNDWKNHKTSCKK